ncbi:hypothetical protein ACWCP6_24085 [Streptomyces sp. NPDC002004]
MTTRPPGDAPLAAAAQDDADPPRISVGADTRTVVAPLLKGAPILVIGALRMGLMMAKGRGTSAGSGTTGLVIGILAFAAPLLWIGLLSGLRWANAGIELANGVLTVRNRWNRKVLHAPLSSLTGLHTVRLPVDGPQQSRIVITSRADRPVMIDPRHWDAQALQELWRHLGVEVRDHGLLTWPLVKARFPGVRVPWYLVHYVLLTVLIVIAAIAYIALVVNLPFLL